MSTIAENITRIQGAKNDIRTAIVGKGVDVPADAHIDEYAGYIQNIKTGGGGGGEPSGKMMIPNGISLSASTFTTLDMGQQDWSKVYDCSLMFQDCSKLETIENFPLDMEMLTCDRLFYNCTKLITGPMMNFSKVTKMGFLFDGCSGLTSVELSDTSNITDMDGWFRDCASLTSVPQFDTSNVTTMNQMFSDCKSLTSVPMMDTSKVTSMYYIFRGCSSLTSVPPLDTSKVTTMEEAFYGCSKLTSVPQLNTCKVKKMNNLFRNCGNLISVGGIDTSSATTMNYMFASCFKLQEVRFTGNPINLTSVTSITQGCPQTGTLYYPAEYADAYQIIINAFPTNWVKVPE